MNQELLLQGLRRQAQWLNKYQLTKWLLTWKCKFAHEETWWKRLEQGCFAKAGLERINLKPDDFIDLDWMIHPAQGAISRGHAKRCIYTECFITVKWYETEIVTYNANFLKL
jgi:hydroxymethylbilane synthase